jgi:hypothetical protein
MAGKAVKNGFRDPLIYQIAAQPHSLSNVPREKTIRAFGTQ